MSLGGQLLTWHLTDPDHDNLTQALPELNALRHVVERNDWHDDDALQQSFRLFHWVKDLPASLLETINAPEAAVRNLLGSAAAPGSARHTTHELLAFAALIHDVGKAKTFQRLPGGITRCPGHEAVSARMAPSLCACFDFTPAETAFITTLVRVHGEPYDLFKEIATLPVPQQHERIRHFQVDHADHLLPLLLLACGDLVTSQLQANKPQKYAALLDFYRRWFRSAFKEEPEDKKN
jgi:hypothetical protein